MICRFLTFVVCLVHAGLACQSAAQASQHRIAGLSILPNGSVRLELQGNATASQSRFFDLFPLERSVDLVRWTALGTATKTNAALGGAFFLDDNVSRKPHAFYRTLTNVMVSPLPPLTGPYAVGSFSRLLTDFTRTNTIRRTNHQFMVTVFYPATPPVRVLPERYWERAMIPSMQKWYGLAPNTNWFSRDYSSAPLAAAERPWPIVLYSPSLNSERRENLYKLLELASHGFVVATTDHRETFASAFPNGSIANGLPIDFSSPQAVYDALAERVTDVRLVYSELARMNVEIAVWKDRLDLGRVGAFGFSMGGMTAAELCRIDDRIHAGAAMDGIFFIPQLLETPLSKPFLYLRADTPEIVMPDGRPDDRLPVMEKMTRDGYYIQISGTVHWSFADLPLLTTKEYFLATVGSGEYPPPNHPLIEPHRINELSATYLVSFFKNYLAGQDDHRLDHPHADAHEILKFVKKVMHCQIQNCSARPRRARNAFVSLAYSSRSPNPSRLK